jgi:hypothetical protein
LLADVAESAAACASSDALFSDAEADVAESAAFEAEAVALVAALVAA